MATKDRRYYKEDWQRDRLERIYQGNKRPTRRQYNDICRDVGIEDRRIVTKWFKDRRRREKKELAQAGGGAGDNSDADASDNELEAAEGLRSLSGLDRSAFQAMKGWSHFSPCLTFTCSEKSARLLGAGMEHAYVECMCPECLQQPEFHERARTLKEFVHHARSQMPEQADESAYYKCIYVNLPATGMQVVPGPGMAVAGLSGSRPLAQMVLEDYIRHVVMSYPVETQTRVWLFVPQSLNSGGSQWKCFTVTANFTVPSYKHRVRQVGKNTDTTKLVCLPLAIRHFGHDVPVPGIASLLFPDPRASYPGPQHALPLTQHAYPNTLSANLSEWTAASMKAEEPALMPDPNGHAQMLTPAGLLPHPQAATAAHVQMLAPGSMDLANLTTLQQAFPAFNLVKGLGAGAGANPPSDTLPPTQPLRLDNPSVPGATPSAPFTSGAPMLVVSGMPAMPAQHLQGTHMPQAVSSPLQAHLRASALPPAITSSTPQYTYPIHPSLPDLDPQLKKFIRPPPPTASEDGAARLCYSTMPSKATASNTNQCSATILSTGEVAMSHAQAASSYLTEPSAAPEPSSSSTYTQAGAIMPSTHPSVGCMHCGQPALLAAVHAGQQLCAGHLAFLQSPLYPGAYVVGLDGLGSAMGLGQVAQGIYMDQAQLALPPPTTAPEQQQLQPAAADPPAQMPVPVLLDSAAMAALPPAKVPGQPDPEATQSFSAKQARPAACGELHDTAASEGLAMGGAPDVQLTSSVPMQVDTLAALSGGQVGVPGITPQVSALAAAAALLAAGGLELGPQPPLAGTGQDAPRGDSPDGSQGGTVSGNSTVSEVSCGVEQRKRKKRKLDPDITSRAPSLVDPTTAVLQASALSHSQLASFKPLASEPTLNPGPTAAQHEPDSIPAAALPPNPQKRPTPTPTAPTSFHTPFQTSQAAQMLTTPAFAPPCVMVPDTATGSFTFFHPPQTQEPLSYDPATNQLAVNIASSRPLPEITPEQYQHYFNLQNAQLQSAAMQATGVHTTVTRSTAMEPTEFHPTITLSTDMHPTGLHTTGTRSTDMQPIALHTTSMHNSGLQGAGMQGKGMQGAGMQAVATPTGKPPPVTVSGQPVDPSQASPQSGGFSSISPGLDAAGTASLTSSQTMPNPFKQQHQQGMSLSTGYMAPARAALSSFTPSHSSMDQSTMYDVQASGGKAVSCPYPMAVAGDAHGEVGMQGASELKHAPPPPTHGKAQESMFMTMARTGAGAMMLPPASRKGAHKVLANLAKVDASRLSLLDVGVAVLEVLDHLFRVENENEGDLTVQCVLAVIKAVLGGDSRTVKKLKSKYDVLFIFNTLGNVGSMKKTIYELAQESLSLRRLELPEKPMLATEAAHMAFMSITPNPSNSSLPFSLLFLQYILKPTLTTPTPDHAQPLRVAGPHCTLASWFTAMGWLNHLGPPMRKFTILALHQAAKRSFKSFTQLANQLCSALAALWRWTDEVAAAAESVGHTAFLLAPLPLDQQPPTAPEDAAMSLLPVLYNHMQDQPADVELALLGWVLCLDMCDPGSMEVVQNLLMLAVHDTAPAWTATLCEEISRCTAKELLQFAKEWMDFAGYQEESDSPFLAVAKESWWQGMGQGSVGESHPGHAKVLAIVAQALVALGLHGGALMQELLAMAVIGMSPSLERQLLGKAGALKAMVSKGSRRGALAVLGRMQREDAWKLPAGSLLHEPEAHTAGADAVKLENPEFKTVDSEFKECESSAKPYQDSLRNSDLDLKPSVSEGGVPSGVLTHPTDSNTQLADSDMRPLTSMGEPRIFSIKGEQDTKADALEPSPMQVDQVPGTDPLSRASSLPGSRFIPISALPFLQCSLSPNAFSCSLSDITNAVLSLLAASNQPPESYAAALFRLITLSPANLRLVYWLAQQAVTSPSPLHPKSPTDPTLIAQAHTGTATLMAQMLTSLVDVLCMDKRIVRQQLQGKEGKGSWEVNEHGEVIPTDESESPTLWADTSEGERCGNFLMMLGQMLDLADMDDVIMRFVERIGLMEDMAEFEVLYTYTMDVVRRHSRLEAQYIAQYMDRSCSGLTVAGSAAVANG